MTTDPTPIPTEALDAVIADFFLHAEPAYGRFDPLVRARIERAFRNVAPDLLAAGRTAAAADPAGFAHAYTITFDGDTHWLECDFCSTPVHPIDAGDSFEVLVTKARDHWRTCGAARVAENGADR